jgi:16S rRNA pseudouridine516 synthase
MNTTLTLAQVLFSQGFGSRRLCAGLIEAGHVRVGGALVREPGAAFDVEEGFEFEVDGQTWPYHAKALLMLHKPSGYECSQKPRHHPSVMSLLPAPLRDRGVQPVGRLDADTTGLLLLTDDGALIHRLSSPRRHVAKVYEARLRHPITEAQLQQLREGVVLDDSPHPVRAAAAEADLAGDRHALRLTLTEGKYHQVKRMLAAVGNRVDGLHRGAFGGLRLPPDLASGQWRWADADAVLAPAEPTPAPR